MVENSSAITPGRSNEFLTPPQVFRGEAKSRFFLHGGFGQFKMMVDFDGVQIPRDIFIDLGKIEFNTREQIRPGLIVEVIGQLYRHRNKHRTAIRIKAEKVEFL